MTSLTDVYEGRTAANSRRRSLGTALFVLGAGLVVAGIVVATTSLAESLGLGMFGSRKVAGTLAGLGVPAALLGAFAVMPAGRATRAAAVVGASVAVFGVALFWHAYPYEWIVAAPLLALATTAVYFFGVLTVFWSLFVALATFKTRNDPGGTARMEITREGTIRLVEEARSLGRFGGIGMFGTDLDGEVETQTNRDTTTTDHDGASVESTTAPVGDGGATETNGIDALDNRPTRSSSQRTDGTPSRSRPGRSQTANGDADRQSIVSRTQPSADGGAVIDESDAGSTDGSAAFSNDFLRSTQADDDLDEYCGNCRHFEYVMDDDEATPYCGFHDRTLDDMDPCSNWLER